MSREKIFNDSTRRDDLKPWYSFPQRNTSWFRRLPPDHLIMDSAHNLGPLISRWVINKLENCRYKSVRILEVLKLLFQHFLNMSSSQRDMIGPILGDLSNNRWLGVKMWRQKRRWQDEKRHWCHYIGLDSLFWKTPTITFKERTFRQKMHLKVPLSRWGLKCQILNQDVEYQFFTS